MQELIEHHQYSLIIFDYSVGENLKIGAAGVLKCGVEIFMGEASAAH